MTAGTILLVLGLLAALGGAVAALLVITGDRSGLAWARRMAYLVLACAGLASFFLMVLILSQRYDVAYVYSYTSKDLPLFYRISAFWAGQQGSFLLWLLLGSILTVLQIRRARQFEPYVLLVLLLVQAGLSVFLLVDSPFARRPEAAADGFGLNPLLQNPWMVAHPPVLFIGYAGLAVPFAYALAGLWRRDYDEWVKLSMPWTLLGWFFLGLGIYLGAFWAYETLGWGGYWGWDLVENSSAIPWLTGTALLHGLLIQRYRQRLRHGNFLLAIGTFLLVIYATYLTRSGVLSQISTHSFVESGLTPWMLGLLAAMAVLGVGFLVSRWTDIPRSPVFAGSSREGKALLEGDVEGTVGTGLWSWFSRDFTFLLTILVLLGITAPVWLGTLVPVVTQLSGGQPASLSVSFYPLTTGPVLLILLAVLSLCPLLGWQESRGVCFLRFLGGSAAFAFLVTLTAVLLGARQPYSLLFVFLGAFALAGNVVMLVRTVRGGILRLGGYLAHVGLGLLVVGIVASTMYSQEALLALAEGRPQEALGYHVTFLGWQEEPGRHPALRLDVEQGSQRYTALPELYTNPQDQSLVATPDVHRYLTHDVYVAAEGYEPAEGEGEVTLIDGGTASVGGYTLTLQALLPADPYIQAVLRAVTPEGTLTITPTYAPTGTGVVGQPATLPGGVSLSVTDATLFGADWPTGTFILLEGQPTVVGPYQVTLLDFSMEMHDQVSGTVAAGAALHFVGPGGTTVITPTEVSSAQGVESPPVELSPGVTVRVVRMSVGQQPQSVIVEIEGLDLPRQGGAAWLRLQSGQNAVVATVRLSVKPGMSFLWAGGIVLLIGTLIAVVRRWREGTRQEVAGRPDEAA